MSETTELKISGMTCGGCVRSVTRVLSALPGVEKADVSLEDSRARVSYDPAKTGAAQMRAAVERAGYGAA